MNRDRWWILVAIAACGGRVGDGTRDASPDTGTGGAAPDAALDGADADDAADGAADANDADTSWCPDGSLFEAGAVDAGAPWGFSDHVNAFHGMMRTGGDEVYIGGSKNGVYLAKLEANGKLAWTKSWGAMASFGFPRALDAYGNVLVAGNAGNWGPIDFGGGAIPTSHGFIVKLDPGGKFISQIIFPGGMSYAYPTTIGLLSNGDLVVIGVFKGNVNLGGGMWSSQTNSVFLVRYDTCGAYVLGKTWSTTAYVSGLVVDSNDNLVVAGGFVGTVDFGGGTLTAPTNDWDPWIAKLTATGNHIASREMKGTGPDNILYPTLDANDNVLVAGSTGGVVDFGGGALKSAGGRDVVVAKLGPNLEYVWAKRYGDASYQWATAPAISQGNIVLTGSFQGSIDFGKGVLTASPNGGSTFVARLDGAGVTISSMASVPSQQTGGSGGVVILPTTSSDVLIAGDYGGPFQLGPKVFPTEDLSGTGFLLRFTP